MRDEIWSLASQPFVRFICRFREYVISNSKYGNHLVGAGQRGGYLGEADRIFSALSRPG
jgi:hypothetical protein